MATFYLYEYNWNLYINDVKHKLKYRNVMNLTEIYAYKKISRVIPTFIFTARQSETCWS